MKRILTILTLLAFAVSMSAQDNAETPAYRNKGYAGNVSFTDTYIILVGLDTSHGYMFNEHHYLGGGLGFYVTKNCPIAYHAFAEYKSYWFKKSSTPTAGVKLGYGGVIMTVEDFHSDAFCPYGEYKVEPYIGWDWGLKSGKGLSLSLGANVLMNNLFTDYAYAIVLPKLSIGISF